MNKKLLNTGVQEFIFKNINADIVSVLLKKQLFQDISNQEVVEQLEARKKCEKKLPTWFRTPGIYYPNKLNIEQTSSEVTARYKAEIVSGKVLLDATGGFGVDSYFFSKKIAQVIHCEIDENLSKITAHNFHILGTSYIKIVSNNGLNFLKNSGSGFDWIYLDPSRRNDGKGKVFRLSDCLPNILSHSDLLFAKSEKILLKTSPLLDFSIGIKELRHVKAIHVISIKNEVKELLWVLEKEYFGEIRINTINFTKSGNQTFDFFLNEEKNFVTTYSDYSEPLSYLYEPNAAILKSGAFKTLGNRLHLKKLHEHSHLYTSKKLIDFPGRRFKIQEVVPFKKKLIAQIGIRKANITIRNFPISVSDLRKKLKIKDGGATFLLFTTDLKMNRIVIVASKIP